jgi:DnaJ-class molecular chaperone
VGMIEYDLPFEKQCSNCNGYGHLIIRSVKYATFINGYSYKKEDCHVCKGKGLVPIGPELELELENE